MADPTYRMRAGSVHGVKHAKLGTNNQDAFQILEFCVPKRDKTYRVGVLADGCSGIPAFTRSEVGAHLSVTYCLMRVQELILGGVAVAEIPWLLYRDLVSALRAVATQFAPAGGFWPYPAKFRGMHEFRNSLSATQRFTVDYLTATVIGFVDDGEMLVTFQAGDGVIIVNDDVMVVDQNDRPEYPATSPYGSFTVETHDAQSVRRLVLASDGIEELMKQSAATLPARLFDHMPTDPAGLQYLLNILRKQNPEKVSDDLTVITRELIGGEDEEAGT